MSKALSVDLRTHVLAAISAGASHGEAAERFGVGGTYNLKKGMFVPVPSEVTAIPA